MAGYNEVTDHKKIQYFKLLGKKGNVPKGLYYTKKVGDKKEKVFLNNLRRHVGVVVIKDITKRTHGGILQEEEEG